MPLTSNIYYSLTPWASGTFSLGQRCGNGGNAYQCTTAGSSTGAPTGTGTGINNGGVAVFAYLSAVNYTSLQAWANALPATLTQPMIGQVWNTGSIATTLGTPYLTLSGHTTSAGNSITVQPAPGDGISSANPLAFNASAGVNFVLPAAGVGSVNYFDITDTNVFITGLQFQDPNASSGSTILFASGTTTITGCIFDGYSQPGGAGMLELGAGGAAGAVFAFSNNLVIDRAPFAVTGAETVNVAYNGAFANNTFVAINAPTNLIGVINQSAAASANTATNNTFIGYSGNIVLLGGAAPSTITASYNAFSAASISGGGLVIGSGNIYSQTTAGLFVNGATNFKLNATSPAIGVGTTDTTDIPSSVDIYNTPRPAGQWSIGAYQYPNVPAVGVAAGKASVAGVSAAGQSVGRAAGQATVLGVAGVSNIAVGTAAGQATVLGRPAIVSVGVAAGQASVVAYSATGAVGGTVTLDNPGPQTINTPFTVTGTFTLAPDLQFANDSSTTFTAMPQSGITPLGDVPFSFTHPGVATTGEQNLLVEDLTTEASAAVNYAVTAIPPPRIAFAAAAIAPTLTNLGSIIPAYVYQQYADDDTVTAFFTAYNNIAQVYLNWFNSINLPIYTNPLISGSMLDWVAQGIYGISRPTLAVTITGPGVGPFNTYQLNTIPINANTGNATTTLYTVTDDIFKRIMTWNIYKGDGFQYSTIWLKRRVMRFLAGVNGTDYNGQTNQVSVSFSAPNVITIKLLTGAVPLTVAPILQAAILGGTLPLPFQYVYNVLIS